MSLLAATFRMQGGLVRADRDYLIDLVRAPLLAVVFLALIRSAHRPDLVVNALVAPVLMSVWSMALLVSGEIIDTDRSLGTLEPVIAAPAPFARVLTGRITATTAISLLAVAEVWLVATLGFRSAPHLYHPLLLVSALLCTAVATAGAASLMAALFVATRTARTFQNSLSYPFLLLGGVFVPLDSLPHWTHPIGRVVYLSWSSDLLRGSLSPAVVSAAIPRLGAVLGLGVLTALLGWVTLRRVLTIVREAGTLGLR